VAASGCASRGAHARAALALPRRLEEQRSGVVARIEVSVVERPGCRSGSAPASSRRRASARLADAGGWFRPSSPSQMRRSARERRREPFPEVAGVRICPCASCSRAASRLDRAGGWSSRSPYRQKSKAAPRRTGRPACSPAAARAPAAPRGPRPRQRPHRVDVRRGELRIGCQQVACPGQAQRAVGAVGGGRQPQKTRQPAHECW